MRPKEPTARKRPRIGDIIEIKTPNGYAYAWYTHRHVEPPKWGMFIQVFSGLYQEPQRDFSDAPERPIQYSTFFPLVQALTMDEISIVDNVPLPKERQEFPKFKQATWNFNSTIVRSWSVWDGKKFDRLDYLKPEFYDLPFLKIVNPPLLIERIAGGRTNADGIPEADLKPR